MSETAATSSEGILGLRVIEGLLVAATAGALLTIDAMLSTTAGSTMLIAVSTILGLREFYAMCIRREGKPLVWLGTASLIVLIAVQIFCIERRIPLAKHLAEAGFIAAVAIFTWHMLLSDPERFMMDVSLTLTGALYLWLGAFFMIGLRYLDNGLVLMVTVIAATKGADACAYAVGRKYGSHKLIPSVSPAKSVEGAAAAIAGAAAITALLGWLSGLIPPIQAIPLGVAIGIGGLTGDLVESAFKRSAVIKDSGRITPRLGGVLDVVDSLIVSAPVAYLIVSYYGN